MADAIGLMAPSLPPRPAAAGVSGPAVAADADPAAIRAAAEAFEAVFVGHMIKPMFATLETAPPFGGGFAEEIWRDVLADEIGRAVVAGGGIGLADTVAAELLRFQEAAAATPVDGDQP